MNIHIVTDSTADLSPAVLDAFGVADSVHVVPLYVHFGEETFVDGVDLTAESFYARLLSSDVTPRTSQPSPGAFVEHYSKISDPGDTILSFHISKQMSGTIQSAMLAARQISDRRIEVVDTKLASMGVGFVAARAAALIKSGESVERTLDRARAWAADTRTFFLVDTLEYLQRNGRIGKAQAMVGGLLNVRPVLTVEDGVVAPLEKVRGQSKARMRLMSHTESYLNECGGSADVAILHARAGGAAWELRDQLASRFPRVRFFVAELGPVVGTHAGPGTLGVVAARA